ncbi:hypothetical protein [Bacillus bombysepticus]|uniref:hypothetical protein n=1 Tax=Bacillus bombysepticus TaxID=658666 RepID=UPI003017FE83
MRLRVKDVQDELVQVIEEVGANKFLRRYCMDILDENGVVIGDVKGTAIRMRAVKQVASKKDAGAFIAAADSVDDIHFHVGAFLLDDELLMGESRVYFLDEVELLEGHRTLENKKEVLDLTFKKMGALIYLFDGDEYMRDLPEDEYEHYWEEHDEMLLNNGWEYNDDFELFFKRRKTAYEAIIKTIEEIEAFQEMLPDVLESPE